MYNEKSTRYTLLQKLQNPNNERSWDEFVAYYRAYIFAIIQRFNVGTEDSEELLQDVLVKIWKNISKFDPQKYECRFRTWLSVMIRNTVFNFFKAKSSRNSKNNVNYDDIIHKLELISEAEINQIAEKEWRNYIAKMAWRNLKDNFNEVTRNIFEDSMKSDIANSVLAEKYDVSESSVRVFKMRVRKAMHKEIIRLNNELET